MSRNDDEIREAAFVSLRRVAPEADPASLPLTANIREALEIDSYDFLQFLIALNKRLDIDIPEADYGKLQTMSSLLSYLRSRCDGAASG
ncbi:MAG: acyl carrier protein [Planctomycetes bacterium]|nr:acyl carrier protein [Planctomycetota bacterium]